MPSKTISIIGPTYNERDNVLPFVKRVEATLGDQDWEIIFVDDNSGDGTASEAFQLSRDDARVRLVLRLMDRGLAKSSIQGMLSAKGDLLCVMDVDGQHDPAVILEMLARMEREDLDLVSAARRLNEMQQDEALSPLRNSISRIGNKLCSLLLGRDLSDPLTGFFIIRRDAFLRVAPKLTDPGFKILLDILSSDKTLRHGETPFDFAPRLAGESKLDSFVVWKFLTFFLSKATAGILSANFISFLLVGALGLVVHLCVLYVLIALAFPFVVAQTGATLVAATSNFFLNDILTFRDLRLRGAAIFWGYIKFLTVSSVGIVANISVANVTYERLGHIVLFSTLVGVAVDAIWKFVLARRFIWK